MADPRGWEHTEEQARSVGEKLKNMWTAEDVLQHSVQHLWAGQSCCVKEVSWQLQEMEVANGANSDTAANLGHAPTKGSSSVLKIWELAHSQDVIRTREKSSYAAADSKDRKTQRPSRPGIKKTLNMAAESLRESSESYWLTLLPDLRPRQRHNILLLKRTALAMNLQHFSLYTHKLTFLHWRLQGEGKKKKRLRVEKVLLASFSVSFRLWSLCLAREKFLGAIAEN